MSQDPRDQKLLRRIGDNLRAERNRRRLTQEAVADRANFPGTSTYQRLEDGETDSGITKYVRAAWAIDVPFEELLRGVEDLQP